MNFSNDHNISDSLVCNSDTVEQIKQLTKFLTIFLKETSKLTESYILDYFVEKLWTYLPNCWLETVMKFEPEDLANFLDSEKQIRCRNPWPLSLLCFRTCAFTLSLSRKPVSSLKSVRNFVKENYNIGCLSEHVDWDSLNSEYEFKSGQHKSIPEFCRRHVKPKKQHEIFCMGQLAAAVLETFKIKHTIDVGSGQGHLSRFLALCYKMNVATVEAEESHLSSAANFDKQAFMTMQKLRERLNNKKLKKSAIGEILPQHLEGSMTSETSKEYLNKIFKRSVENVHYDSKERFALLGLHTCGDLAPTILKLFTECQDCKVVLSVGCCYMKLTSDMNDEGYPLSSHVKSLSDHSLSYEAKEMACHALEMYKKRLIENSPSLKIHCYRATLEKCIMHHYPDKKHMGLRGVKNAENLPFSEYAKKALSKVSCVIPEEFYLCPDVQACLDKWKEVLTFYSLRLLIAPVVESLILLDRMLFLYEHGDPSCLIPLFDPEISPRNHVLISASKF